MWGLLGYKSGPKEKIPLWYVGDMTPEMEECLKQFKAWIVENNYDSYVLTSAGTRIKEVEKNGTKVLLGPVDSKNPFVIFKNIFLIISNIKKYNIKIIHVRSRAPAWSVFFVSKFIDVRCISTFHGTYNFRGYLKSVFCKPVEKLFEKKL